MAGLTLLAAAISEGGAGDIDLRATEAFAERLEDSDSEYEERRPRQPGRGGRGGSLMHATMSALHESPRKRARVHALAFGDTDAALSGGSGGGGGGGGGGGMGIEDVGATVRVDVDTVRIALASLSSVPDPLHIVELCNVDLADTHVDGLSLVFQSRVEAGDEEFEGALKHNQTTPRCVQFRIPECLEAWSAPDRSVDDCVSAAIHVVTPVTEDRVAHFAYPIAPMPLTTIKVQTAAVSRRRKALLVTFMSGELKKSCQESGCPFVFVVSVFPCQGVIVHLVTLPFFVNWKQPKKAGVKGPQIRSAGRFRDLAVRGSLLLPSSGVLSDGVPWPRLSPGQQEALRTLMARAVLDRAAGTARRAIPFVAHAADLHGGTWGHGEALRRAGTAPPVAAAEMGRGPGSGAQEQLWADSRPVNPPPLLPAQGEALSILDRLRAVIERAEPSPDLMRILDDALACARKGEVDPFAAGGESGSRNVRSSAHDVQVLLGNLGRGRGPALADDFGAAQVSEVRPHATAASGQAGAPGTTAPEVQDLPRSQDWMMMSQTSIQSLGFTVDLPYQDPDKADSDSSN